MLHASSLTFLTTLAAGVKVNTLHVQTGAEKSFSEYQAQFGKTYDTIAELGHRMNIWK